MAAPDRVGLSGRVIATSFGEPRKRGIFVRGVRHHSSLVLPAALAYVVILTTRTRQSMDKIVMDRMVSAVEANRQFSQLLGSVKEGMRYTVTSHGKPVARITPVSREDRLPEEARRALLARLESQPVTEIGSWTRDELYDE